MNLLIENIQGDITKCEVDIIVNAANNNFWMGAGVAGAIKTAGGELVEKEAVAKGPVMPGEVVYGTAGKLPFRYIIHAAVMGQDLRTNRELIRKATVASLNLADRLGVKSIAFPAFGTGVGDFPMQACANIMTTAAQNYSSMTKHLQLIQFCLFDDIAKKLFDDALRKILSAS